MVSGTMTRLISKRQSFSIVRMAAWLLSAPWFVDAVLRLRGQVNPIMGILKPQSNAPLYSKTRWLVQWPLMGWLRLIGGWYSEERTGRVRSSLYQM